MTVIQADPQTAALISGDPAAGLSFWQREPLLLVGQVKLILGLLAGAGLVISDHTTAGIVAFAAGVAALAAAYVGRSKVTPEPKAKARVNLAKTEVAEASDVRIREMWNRASELEDDAHNAHAILGVLHSVRGTGPVSGPSPASALHPLVEDPIIPGVNDQ